MGAKALIISIDYKGAQSKGPEARSQGGWLKICRDLLLLSMQIYNLPLKNLLTEPCRCKHTWNCSFPWIFSTQAYFEPLMNIHEPNFYAFRRKWARAWSLCVKEWWTTNLHLQDCKHQRNQSPTAELLHTALTSALHTKCARQEPTQLRALCKGVGNNMSDKQTLLHKASDSAHLQIRSKAI